MREDPFEVAVGDGVLHGHRGGVGPPAPFLHGGPGFPDYTAGLARELAPLLTTHRYTQRGTPPSTVGPPYTVEAHMEDALHVLDAFGIERAWAIGHSWGGFLALHLLVAHRERLLGTVCINALGVFDAFAELGAKLRAGLTAEEIARVDEVEELRRRGEATESDVVERFAILWPQYFADPSNAAPNPITRIGVGCSTDTIASVVWHFERGTLIDGLPRARLPALFVHGELDPLPLRGAAEAAALIPGARVEIIEACGHFAWLERPRSVYAAVERFLRENG